MVAGQRLGRARRSSKGGTVDHAQFDRVARAFGAATSRRLALRGLAVSLLGGVGLGAILKDASAQRRRCGAQYAGCNQERDCCHGLICKNLVNPHAEAEFSGTCAYRRGCGRNNDFCKRNRDCCTRQYRCQNRRCQRRRK
jgi:hypothetical protein